MWCLILPDCRTCEVRFAADWKSKLCHVCLAETELLEGWMEDAHPTQG